MHWGFLGPSKGPMDGPSLLVTALCPPQAILLCGAKWSKSPIAKADTHARRDSSRNSRATRAPSSSAAGSATYSARGRACAARTRTTSSRCTRPFARARSASTAASRRIAATPGATATRTTTSRCQARALARSAAARSPLYTCKTAGKTTGTPPACPCLARRLAFLGPGDVGRPLQARVDG